MVIDIGLQNKQSLLPLGWELCLPHWITEVDFAELRLWSVLSAHLGGIGFWLNLTGKKSIHQPQGRVLRPSIACP